MSASSSTPVPNRKSSTGRASNSTQRTMTRYCSGVSAARNAASSSRDSCSCLAVSLRPPDLELRRGRRERIQQAHTPPGQQQLSRSSQSSIRPHRRANNSSLEYSSNVESNRYRPIAPTGSNTSNGGIRPLSWRTACAARSFRQRRPQRGTSRPPPESRRARRTGPSSRPLPQRLRRSTRQGRTWQPCRRCASPRRSRRG